MVKAGGKEIGEGLGISGMTFGILSIVFASYIGIILSIIGFIFSLNQQKNNPTKTRKIRNNTKYHWICFKCSLHNRFNFLADSSNAKITNWFFSLK